MRAWTMDGAFGLDSLKLKEAPRPEPGPGQLLIEAEAFSLNFRDLMVVRGEYNPRLPLPHVPGSDAVGVVKSVGDGVTRFEVGDRVAPIFAPDWLGGPPTKARMRGALGCPVPGVFQEQIVVHESAAVAVPAFLTPVAAATLPCAAVTAWSALVTYGGLRAGETVLVEGTGGVSIFALQIARAFGARVLATTSREERRTRLEELGAEATLNYRDGSNWGKAARVWAGGEGVDHVVDVGGTATLPQAIRAIRPGGRISVIGVLSGATPPFDVRPILMNHITVQGIFVGHRDGFEALNRAVTANSIEPVIDRVFDFEQLPDALRYLESGQHFGKVVVRAA